jgi:hypothetical protein
MSTDNWEALPGAVAGSSFAAAKYRFAKMGATAFTVIPCSVLGELAIGVAYDDVSVAGQSITIAERGIVKVIASAAIAAGARIATAADGRAVTAATTNTVLGIAMTPALAVGDIISVQLVGPFIQP